MMLRLAVMSALCMPMLAIGTAKAATPAVPAVPQVLATADTPTFQAIRTDTTSTTIAPADSAPMPDVDATAPVAQQDTATQIKPAFYANKKEFRGDGFAYGSTAQAVQERSIRPAAGLALNVPLD